MDSDLIDNASYTSTFNYKDFSRKKRRSAKLKQCKLDARREQWLSQCAVKNKDCCKEGTNGGDPKKMQRGERDHSLGNLEMKRIAETNGGGENESVHHESDSEFSPSNSPTSSRLFEGTDSGASFSNSSSSTSSGGGCSGCITEEEGDDGCLGDWETVADALAADVDKQETGQNENNRENPCLESNHGHDPNINLRNSKPECPRMVQRTTGSSNAWRADDAFRPQSLPNLSKQRSFPAMERQFGQGKASWSHNGALLVPSSCPICYEDLDSTDLSFLPCLCGFRLCLFCHKRILEEDGRCPGCRKPYEHDSVVAETSVRAGNLTLRLAPSCSMIARSRKQSPFS